MKALIILLCLAVAVYAVEVHQDFIDSALALKRHALEQGLHKHSISKRKMLDLYWSVKMNGRCSPLGEICHMFQDCCNDHFCDNFMNGKCVRELPY